jgi:hypothetical protein
LSEVKVDGYVRIPERAWYHVIDFLTRMDEQLEVLIKQLDYTNKQLEQAVYLLGMIAEARAVAPPAPAPPTPIPGPPIPTPTKVIALPFRVKPIGTTKYTATEEAVLELPLVGDAFIMGVDSDVYIGERRDVQNFLLVAGAYLTVYRPAELDRLYVRSAVGTANVYVMYLQVVNQGGASSR